MKIKNLILISVLFLGVAFLVNSVFRSDERDLSDKNQVSEHNKSNIKKTDSDKKVLIKEIKYAHENEIFFKETVANIQNRYEFEILFKKKQYEFIRELRSFLKSKYPGQDTKILFEQYLKAAFPDLYEQLILLTNKIDLYNSWIEQNPQYFISNSSLNEIMDKRREFFGKDADEIWAQEIKNSKTNSAVKDFAENTDDSFSEKVIKFRETINALYGDNSESFISGNSEKLAVMVIENRSIQNALTDMENEERHVYIENIRTAMGMPEKKVKFLKSYDMAKDKEWEKGSDYRKNYDSINSESVGDEKEEKLNELRKNVFGDMAKTIKIEEQAGFYRYNTKRIYGKN
ncbi:MAG: hypothetical protein GY714_13125 [Desulfobacterales bacterium]|nr:hypothetical protein [Desulfobacterales bacterium]